ncbi:diphthine synthase [archaeon]|nr:diphthine synthase [archaeon]
MLYLIGLGLNNEKDLSLNAVETLKKCSSVYAEVYTNVWHGDIKKLEKLIGKKIAVLERSSVENNSVLDDGKSKKVALLIPGDPLSATTHIELIMEARRRGIRISIIHSASIYTAIAETGLQLYKFGRSTTLVMPQKNFNPSSPYEIIAENKKRGLHTLVLLDVNREEKKYMKIKDAVENMIKFGFDPKEKIIACCRLGSPKGVIKYGVMQEISKDKELDSVPAVIIFPGELNFKEEEMLELWK